MAEKEITINFAEHEAGMVASNAFEEYGVELNEHEQTVIAQAIYRQCIYARVRALRHTDYVTK